MALPRSPEICLMLQRFHLPDPESVSAIATGSEFTVCARCCCATVTDMVSGHAGHAQQLCLAATKFWENMVGTTDEHACPWRSAPHMDSQLR